MIPVPFDDYEQGDLLAFLPGDKELTAFMLESFSNPPIAKAVVEKWFNEPDNKKVRVKEMLFATSTPLYSLIQVKPGIDKTHAFVHIATIMSDIIIHSDALRMHIVLFLMTEWFTETSMIDYLNKP